MGGVAPAVLAAAAFGTADFLGGLASRRASALVSVVVAQVAGFAVVLPVLLLQPAAVDRAGVAWGALGGVAGGLGLLVFFRVLAGGVMSTAAPVTAVVAAGLPVLAGVLLGERPGAHAWVGVGAGILAVGVISGRGGRLDGRALGLALLAGAGFGLFFICLSRTSPATGLWPLAAARMGSLTVLALVALLARTEWRAEPAALRLAVLSGVLDMSANALFLLAVRGGELALVAVLVSLYPAATVMLALGLLRERLRVPQAAGVALALAAIGLIASG